MSAIARKVDEIVRASAGQREDLVGVLQDIQTEFNYLPEEALRAVAERMDVPLSDVYGLATFYKMFSLKPKGKHNITVCLGTACHVRGGPRVVDEFEKKLSVKPGETTSDNQVTLETVNCLGCCALGPIAVVDGRYHGMMSSVKAGQIIASISRKPKSRTSCGSPTRRKKKR